MRRKVFGGLPEKVCGWAPEADADWSLHVGQVIWSPAGTGF